ncbi:DUF6283 family protein [Streptomyces phaeochromogenes]|uniref:DUF6283 family protein n=1 Tax=Streptomyces phaeochromogenes TaxID=1923 RepID=UPI0033DDCFAF
MTSPSTQRPCESCPCRPDVPAGIWASEEYANLRRYGAETPDQPAGLFQCHQADADSAVRRVCAGWAGCHEGEELLALRLAVLDGCIDAAAYKDCGRVRVAGAPVPFRQRSRCSR